ncbi:hypothetical protein N7478_010866 [Penicillium angulare]|uniref:uncharacterized protein n=1 Tax=Penicillium angulare TaxID=116970 RepID=UPI002540A606|nr:uncharacterized protein N7478_010866 [Penicillium angulare]KAJ5263261.1 hypothetical protein N7478_010866 [Penicillium angulare]
MGGIPYKSLGCGTCKKRKIRCDLGLPGCARCIKKGTPCPGYEKGRNFVHHTVVTRRENQGMTKRPIAQLVGHLKPLALPETFSMSAEVRTELFSDFFSSYFPVGLGQNDKNDSLYYLMTRFPAMAGESALLDRAVIALAAAWVGKMKNDEVLKHQGTELYSNAIHLLARRLSDGSLPTADVLFAVVIFMNYEIVQQSGIVNCLTHIRGAKALLKNYQHDADDQLIQAINTQQKWGSMYFLTKMPQRKGLDCQDETHAEGDGPLSELFRLVAETSFLLDELDRICELGYSDMTTACEGLLQSCNDYENRLQMKWLAEDAINLDGEPVPCSPMELDCSTDVLPWSHYLQPYTFESIETATTYLLFWVASVIVRRVIYRVESIMGWNADSTQLLFFASEISRTVAYCLQPQNRMCTGNVLCFGISQANMGYVDCGHEQGFLWSQQMYQVLQEKGFDIASMRSGLEWTCWKEAETQRDGMHHDVANLAF